jgi:hypothetical protein
MPSFDGRASALLQGSLSSCLSSARHPGRDAAYYKDILYGILFLQPGELHGRLLGVSV